MSNLTKLERLELANLKTYRDFRKAQGIGLTKNALSRLVELLLIEDNDKIILFSRGDWKVDEEFSIIGFNASFSMYDYTIDSSFPVLVDIETMRYTNQMFDPHMGDDSEESMYNTDLDYRACVSFLFENLGIPLFDQEEYDIAYGLDKATRNG